MPDLETERRNRIRREKSLPRFGRTHPRLSRTCAHILVVVETTPEFVETSADPVETSPNLVDTQDMVELGGSTLLFVLARLGASQEFALQLRHL